MNTEKSEFENQNLFLLIRRIYSQTTVNPDNNVGQFTNTSYFTTKETKSKLSSSDGNSFSILHPNIKSF